jgi:hypothetical protein
VAKTIPTLDKNNRCSVIFCNGDFVLFEPLFGYGMYVPLPNSKREVFNLFEITVAALGRNVKEMFENSRVLDVSEVDDFFEPNQIDKWVKDSEVLTIKLVNKKNKTDFYKNMMQIPAARENDVISFRPTKHDRSDYYSGINPGSGPEIVKLPLSSSDEEIGEALKLALTRCTGLGAYEFHKKLKALGWEE